MEPISFETSSKSSSNVHSLQKSMKQTWNIQKEIFGLGGISALTDRYSQTLGNSFHGPVAFVVGGMALCALWVALIVASIFLWVFWPLLLVTGVLILFYVGVARAFASLDDVRKREYPRLIAALAAQACLAVPLYLLGPVVLLTGSITGVIVFTSVFVALCIAMGVALLTTVHSAYSIHADQASGPSSRMSPGTGFTLGGHGDEGGHHEDERTSASAGTPQHTPGPDPLSSGDFPSMQTLISAGPLSLFVQYPVLLLALCIAPVISTLLLLLIVTSPYWFVWWYVTAPILLTTVIGGEVTLVCLYWSKVFSQAMIGWARDVFKRTVAGTLGVGRVLWQQSKTVFDLARDRMRKRTTASSRFRTFKGSAEPASGTDESDASGSNFGSSSSSVVSSRRSSHGAEGLNGVGNESTPGNPTHTTSPEPTEPEESKTSVSGSKRKGTKGKH